MTILQPHAPILVIGYGYQGATWLADLRASLHLERTAPDDTRPDALIQFWAVGLDPEEQNGEFEGLSVAPPDVTPQRLRADLDTSREQRLVDRFPSLSVTDVLVLERWSPYHVRPEDRLTLHAKMDHCRRVNFRPGAPREVKFEWISLIDCARPPGPLTGKLAADVRAHFEGEQLTLLNLLVDRANDKSAVLSEHEADRMLATVARSFVMASLGGRSIVSKLLESNRGDTDDRLQVRGISVTRFQHGPAELGRAATHRLAFRLREGRLDKGATSSPSELLAQRIREDLGSTSGVAGRLTSPERQQAVQRALSRALALRRLETDWPWQELDEAQTVMESFNARSPSGSTRGAVAVPCNPDTPIPGPWRRFLELLRPLFRRRPVSESTTAQSVAAQAQVSESPAQKDWRDLIERATQVRSAWEAWLFERGDPIEPTSIWRADDSSFALHAWPEAGSDPEPVPPSYWEGLSRELMSLVPDAEAPNMTPRALERLAPRLEIGSSSEGAASLVVRALRRFQSDGPGRAWPRICLFRGIECRTDWVFWFHGLQGLQEDVFRSLEGTNTHFELVKVPIPSLNSTVRVAVSEPYRWNEVLSLMPDPGDEAGS